MLKKTPWPSRAQKRNKFGLKLKTLHCTSNTVKLGYNDHGYNEFTAITTKIY